MNRSNTKFNNQKLNDHCDAVEEEFQALLGELGQGREKRGGTNDWYLLHAEYYNKGVMD
jgi:hypothetical protein